VSISIDMARKILEASKQRARDLRSPVSIAIVDAGGHLVLFERMMSPYGWATGNISIAKANTAVMFNQSTDSVAQWGSGIPGFASSMTAMTNGKFIMAAGGWPIRINGATVGGIGVSGGNAAGRDDDIARSGLAAADAISETMAPPIPVRPPAVSGLPMPGAAIPPSIYPEQSFYGNPNLANPVAPPLVQQPSTRVLPEYEASSMQDLSSTQDEQPYQYNPFNEQSKTDRPGGQS